MVIINTILFRIIYKKVENSLKISKKLYFVFRDEEIQDNPEMVLNSMRAYLKLVKPKYLIIEASHPASDGGSTNSVEAEDIVDSFECVSIMRTFFKLIYIQLMVQFSGNIYL